MRAHMIACQIRPNKVTEQRLVAAMAGLPRERFVPEARRAVAYVDEDLELGAGRFLMEPVLFARLVSGAAVGQHDRVLDIGCATGYSTALLAQLAADVLGLEADAALAGEAERQLAALDAGNARIAVGALDAGHADGAPWDVIMLQGAVEFVPAALFDQLADGGRLVTVVRGAGVSGASRAGQAVRFIRSGGNISRRVLFDAATPPLPGFCRKAGFVF